MEKTFDPADFVKCVGHSLVAAFTMARKATTPTLIGDAMESSVRERLMQILPKGIGVGSGCVIDTFGGTSRQMDVVLYEKEQCSVFCINKSPNTTYFPCEGVLAVGEVKSRIGKKELTDSFKKIKSVKSLRRAFDSIQDGQQMEQIGRPYGNYDSSVAYSFDLHNTNLGDIFGFVVAGEPGARISSYKTGPSISHYYARNVNALGNDVLCPDMVVFLNGNVLIPVTVDTENEVSGDYTPTRSNRLLPHAIMPKDSESPFGELLQAIWYRHEQGLTAHIPLSRYIQHDTNTKPRPRYVSYVHWGPDNLKPGKYTKTPTDHLNPQRTHRTKSLQQR